MSSTKNPPKARLYKGEYETERIEFSRVWAQSTPWTFTIPAVKYLLEKYVKDGRGWIDPFAGDNSPAEFTNDHHPKRKAKFHLEAIDFCRQMNAAVGKYKGVLFDPPYSFTQVREHYAGLGKKTEREKTSTEFYEKIRSELWDRIDRGGYAISFGWNSNGFGKTKGFKIIEIMQIAHGGSRNDTICTVEQKI